MLSSLTKLQNLAPIHDVKIKQIFGNVYTSLKHKRKSTERTRVRAFHSYTT